MGVEVTVYVEKRDKKDGTWHRLEIFRKNKEEKTIEPIILTYGFSSLMRALSEFESMGIAYRLRKEDLGKDLREDLHIDDNDCLDCYGIHPESLRQYAKNDADASGFVADGNWDGERPIDEEEVVSISEFSAMSEEAQTAISKGMTIRSWCDSEKALVEAKRLSSLYQAITLIDEENNSGWNEEYRLIAIAWY